METLAYIIGIAIVLYGLYKKFIHKKPRKPKVFEPESSHGMCKAEEILLGSLINELRYSKNKTLLESEAFLYDPVIDIRIDRVIDNFIKRTADKTIPKKKRLWHGDFGLITIITRNAGIAHEGENLGYGYSSYLACFNAWCKSEKHRKMMLEPYWKYFAIKIKRHPTLNRFFYVALFAK